MLLMFISYGSVGFHHASVSRLKLTQSTQFSAWRGFLASVPGVRTEANYDTHSLFFVEAAIIERLNKSVTCTN